MTRRKVPKPKNVRDGTTSPEAVERLKDAVGRLIARRILREWCLNRQSPGTSTGSSTGAKHKN